ncbi:MAG TPA: ATP-binding protein [Aquaticitalea sp.]|nr:ATP-binding protein [Aquaticitalea sp.]HNU60205.1 ATP-binding protein [Aquaticitalea sp.]
MHTRKIVVTGGPGTGKSSIISELKNRGHICFEEISREVTLEARKQGIDQLFLTKPLLFSELLLEGRLKQFKEASDHIGQMVFIDRGLPDVLAYMNYASTEFPESFNSICQENRYDKIFILAPWEEIFVSDSVRYENFEQANRIHFHLVATYHKLGYELVNVPFGTVSDRSDFIEEVLKL